MKILHETKKNKKNKNMKKVSAIIMIFLIVSSITALFPYPIFSGYTNISQNEAFQINNFHETEISSQNFQKIEVLNLKFEQISPFFPLFCKFEIFDMTTNQMFTAIRVGGRNHIDVEVADNLNAEIVAKIANQINEKEIANLQINLKWNLTPHPVLVKINDNAFLPASIAYYPHGYSSDTNPLNGHFCLHFNHSRTDGTNKSEKMHQRCVSYAKQHSKEFLQQNIF